jgi:hypothetical protein
MKNILIIVTVLLVGCASPNTDSISRDRTMADMAKTALINEMLNSPDQAVRLEGARIAKDFVVPKRRFFDF